MNETPKHTISIEYIECPVCYRVFGNAISKNKWEFEGKEVYSDYCWNCGFGIEAHERDNPFIKMTQEEINSFPKDKRPKRPKIWRKDPIWHTAIEDGLPEDDPKAYSALYCDLCEDRNMVHAINNEIMTDWVELDDEVICLNCFLRIYIATDGDIEDYPGKDDKRFVDYIRNMDNKSLAKIADICKLYK